MGIPFGSSSFQEPDLLPDLRRALSALYSLQTVDTKRPSATEAHEYLVQFQNRNLRRKFQSQHKTQQNQTNQKTFCQNDDPNIARPELSEYGSTWLACISLISSFVQISTNTNTTPTNQNINFAEALFATQTLVHRLRRVRLSEAIDIEFEFYATTKDGSSKMSTLPPLPSQIWDCYSSWIIHRFTASPSLPFFDRLSHILQSEYHPFTDTTHFAAIEVEERVKGEMSLLLLAAILYAINKSCYQHKQLDNALFSKARPLLTSLSTGMAVISARMRYTPMSLPSPSLNTQPIVGMVLHCINMIHPQHILVSCQDYESRNNLYFVCLAALPDAILQQAGGGLSRFSLEPRCYTAILTELKTQGIIHVWQVFQETTVNSTNRTNVETIRQRSISNALLLEMLEAWAKHVPLPIEFVSATVPLVLQATNGQELQNHNQVNEQYSTEAKASFRYWIAVMEGGSWTVDQVLAASLLQSKESSHQPNKKRQSSKSKRREQHVLEERTTDDLFNLAKKEVLHRGQVACTMAQMTWPVFRALLDDELRNIDTEKRKQMQAPDIRDEEEAEFDIQGDGPIGAITTCACSCLPYIVRTTAFGNIDRTERDLFAFICQSVQEICKSPSQLVRSFAAESLYILHETLTDVLTKETFSSSINEELMEVIIQHFHHCSMSLAALCGYPPGYFNDMARSNDEDLESERNDVRDLWRTVSALHTSSFLAGECTSTSATAISSSILLQLIQSCAGPIEEAVKKDSLFPETALHAFSALAKSINMAAILYVSSSPTRHVWTDNIKTILKTTIHLLSIAGTCIVLAFQQYSARDILPLSRLYNLAASSLTPTLSTLIQLEHEELEISKLIRTVTQAATVSLLRLPELTGPSSFRGSRFDIRGAMRSPGGEDHVGVLTLMRLANESEQLSRVLLGSHETFLVDLCSLYKELERMEFARGGGVLHGMGVIPKSRRILLGIICHLAFVSGGENQIYSLLRDMFFSVIESIAEVNYNSFDEHSLRRICENCFDLAAFSPKICVDFFAFSDDSGLQARCLQVIFQAGCFGYISAANDNVAYQSLIQWNRCRASFFVLFKTSGTPDLPVCAIELISSWIIIECEAVITQCNQGPASLSVIFQKELICEEAVPAGLFIRMCTEMIERSPIVVLQNVLQILSRTKQHVLRAVISQCPNPSKKGSFHDPRPVIAETWFLCMNILCDSISSHEEVFKAALPSNIAAIVKVLLVESFSAAVTLLLYPSLERTETLRSLDPGMTLDGPQGLMLMDFFDKYFSIGPSMLQSAAKELAASVPIEQGQDPDAAGIAVIGATLFRGLQGGLPPWAVERVPTVYCSFYQGLNKSADKFGSMLEISMSARLRQDHCYGSVSGGALLSGRFFEKVSDKTKMTFLEQAKELARMDTLASWKRLKTLIKQLCGGKRKDTDFNQRSALTRWDTLDRV